MRTADTSLTCSVSRVPGKGMFSHFFSWRSAARGALRPDVSVFDQKSAANRYHLLDLLRFLACMAVIFWHYQHFYYVQTHVLPTDWVRSAQPFFPLLFPAYLYGDKGVQVFWVLSGFVFTALFARNIHEGKLSPSRFASERFSRLYPLHLLSLLLVTLLVGLVRARMGNDGIYRNNDLYHFCINLFFVPSVLPNNGLSFNGPSWSVSLELLAYVAFFLCARFTKLTFSKTACLAVVFACLKPWPLSFPRGLEINECLSCFFAGGTVFLAMRSLSERIHYLLAYFLFLAACFSVAWVGRQTGLWIVFAVSVFAYPGAIPSRLARICTHLGDLTYAIYMLHVPVQLCLMLGVDRLWGKRTVELAGSPRFFLCYLAILLVVAFAAYHGFELPVKKRLRAWFSSSPAAKAD